MMLDWDGLGWVSLVVALGLDVDRCSGSRVMIKRKKSRERKTKRLMKISMDTLKAGSAASILPNRKLFISRKQCRNSSSTNESLKGQLNSRLKTTQKTVAVMKKTMAMTTSLTLKYPTNVAEFSTLVGIHTSEIMQEAPRLQIFPIAINFATACPQTFARSSM